MTFDTSDSSVAEAIEGLAPYLREILHEGARRARWLRSDEVHLVHVLGAAAGNEDSALGQVVEHAFADPETLDVEMLSISPGLMVVGAKGTLPFSGGALRALENARRGALQAGQSSIEPFNLAQACAGELNEPTLTGIHRALPPANWPSAPKMQVPGQAGTQLESDGHLFQGLGPSTKRALVYACRAAQQAEEMFIGPLRLLVGSLEADSGLTEACHWTAAKVRASTRQLDQSEPEGDPEPLGPADDLRCVLTELKPGGDSLDLLALTLSTGSVELRALFGRHRITPMLVQKARGAFSDPTP